MTEPIIIDGVDVNEHCKNCFELQQENEKLKEQLSAQGLIEIYEKNKRYKQALDDIKKDCKFVVENEEWFGSYEAKRSQRFLNIISKAKGGENVG